MTAASDQAAAEPNVSRQTLGGHSWPTVLNTLIRRESLDAGATAWAMDSIMRGEATPVQVAGFAVALRAKGETVEEVEGLVAAMYQHAAEITVPGPIVDIVGTGGDMARTVNISTMSAIVAAGAGVVVVKHGNRAQSSASGAADVLEALGVRLDLPAARVAEVAAEAGSPSASRRCSTRRCATPAWPARSSACRPPSTCSAR